MSKSHLNGKGTVFVTNVVFTFLKSHYNLNLLYITSEKTNNAYTSFKKLNLTQCFVQ